MKRLKNMKDIFTNSGILTLFLLEKKYKKTQKEIAGGIKLMAKKDVTISKITLKIEETIKQPKIEGKKERKMVTSNIAKKEISGPWHLETLKEKVVEFVIPINISKQKKTEKKVYKGDMALMNKAHDQSKQTVFLYKIFAEIKVKGERTPVKLDHQLVIE